MNASPKQVVVVGHDFTETADRALGRAFAIAGERPTTLHVVTVITFARPLMPVSRGIALASFDAELAQLRGEVAEELRSQVIGRAPKGLADLVLHTRVGDPAGEIVALAAEVSADLLVVGTHGRRGLGHLLLGSVAERIVQRAGCPVLVEREKHHVGEPPAIEPPCPDCERARAESDGRVLWCARHAQHHLRPHAMHYEGPDFDSARPWGFDE
jgi:nucleotide-binding universal stress UspA family protein